jgi:polar amino acid transport system permease protein
MVVAGMRMSSNRIARTTAFLYVWFIRAIPTLVLLLLIFFLGALLPTVGLGIPFGPEFVSFQTNDLISASSAAIVGLGIYLGGYAAEIFRGAILSVPQGQYEASKALGMPTGLMMRRQIMPQAVRVMIPALANELITMFKSTALVTVIGYTELLTTAQLIYSRNFQTIPLLTVACLWYLVITSVAMYGQQRLEKHYNRGFRYMPKSNRAMRKSKVSTVEGARHEA